MPKNKLAVLLMQVRLSPIALCMPELPQKGKLNTSCRYMRQSLVVLGLRALLLVVSAAPRLPSRTGLGLTAVIIIGAL
jgi:hypothetical protein